MRVYIAGPMSNLPDFNYPAFHRAAGLLEQAGYQVLNPARSEGREGCSTWLDFIRAALRDVANADGVALLPGWQDSRGARIERDLARDLGLDVRPIADWINGGDQ